MGSAMFTFGARTKAMAGRDATVPRRCRTILRRTGGGVTLAGMNTLAEVEAAVPQLSAEELAELERFVRNARLTKPQAGGRSALDLPPLDLGRMLEPSGSRVEWYDEMMEARA